MKILNAMIMMHVLRTGVIALKDANTNKLIAVITVNVLLTAAMMDVNMNL